MRLPGEPCAGCARPRTRPIPYRRPNRDISMMRAVVVGAGSIGRGFLAQLFYEAGYALTFIDSDERLVDALNGAGHYELRLVGKGVETIDIAGFRALHTGDIEAVTRAAAEADIACTAAGGRAL